MEWLPALPQDVAAFVDDQAQLMSIATVKRRVEAIKFAHRMSDLPSPAGHSEVLLAVRRAGRAKRRRPNQALGLTADILERMVAGCPDDLAGLRDAALISVGYDTLCRSSELVAMRVEHISNDFSTICVPRSKSDPFGDGDLPRDFHPALIRASAVVVMPFGALFAMGSGMPDPIAKIVSA